jgi:hypothetical protein
MVVGFTINYAVSAIVRNSEGQMLTSLDEEHEYYIAARGGAGGRGNKFFLSNECSHFHQYFSYIVAVSFIVGRNRRTRRKPPTCRKSLTNFIT